MMENKTFLLKLRKRPFEAIKRGTKKVEIRACEKGDNPDFSLMVAGDVIIFENENGVGKLRCVIEKITHYSNVRDLLIAEGTEHTLSSTDDIEKGIKSVESIGNYKEIIKLNGVFAIRLKDVIEIK